MVYGSTLAQPGDTQLNNGHAHRLPARPSRKDLCRCVSEGDRSGGKRLAKPSLLCRDSRASAGGFGSSSGLGRRGIWAAASGLDRSSRTCGRCNPSCDPLSSFSVWPADFQYVGREPAFRDYAEAVRSAAARAPDAGTDQEIADMALRTVKAARLNNTQLRPTTTASSIRDGHVGVPGPGLRLWSRSSPFWCLWRL